MGGGGGGGGGGEFSGSIFITFKGCLLLNSVKWLAMFVWRLHYNTTLVLITLHPRV